MSYRRFHFKHKQTIVTILAEEERYYRVAVDAILEARKEIEYQIKKDPFFLTTFDPYDCVGSIIGRMCKASKLANVGPMAAVAGTIAQYAVERMIEEGANFAVVDNGGDMAIFTDRELVVGVYAGEANLKIGFRIKPSSEITAICTSSGTIGPSISLGFADAATIFASDASVADAFATALGNEIKEEFGREEIEETLKTFWNKAKDHIKGAMVIKGEIIGLAGNIPEIVQAEIRPDLITKG